MFKNNPSEARAFLYPFHESRRSFPISHHCRPNAELVNFELVALLPIREDQEITIDYGEDACECDRAHAPDSRT